MKPKLLKITLAIAVLVAVGYLFLSGKIGQTKKNIDNVATENVFCGKNYTAEILKINDIDVVKRIIEIWEEREGKCEFDFEGENIGVAKKVSADGKIYNIVLYDKNNKEQSEDPFNQSVEQFEINLDDNTIAYQLQLDGSFFEIGKFKKEFETSDWKTYKNEEYGFELSHPKNLKTSHSDMKGRSVAIDGDNLILNINPVNFIKEGDVKSICYMADIGDTRILEKLEVNGSKMPLCIDDSQKEILIFYRILIPKNKNQTISNIGDYFEVEAQIYGSSSIQDRLNMFKQILSTFKFTD